MSKEVQKKIEEISYLLIYQAELKSVGNDLTSQAKNTLTKLLGKLGYHKLPTEELTRESVEPILIKHFNKKAGVLNFMEFAKEIIGKFSRLPKEKPPLISRTRAEFAVGKTDCSGREFAPDEWEDLVRTIIDGAEIQRDMDYYDFYKLGEV